MPNQATSSWRFHPGFFLSLTLLLAVLIACSRSSNNCTATLNYDGKTYTGAGKSQDDAEHFACNKYCREDDPEYDAMYRIWLDSAAGRAAGRPSKQEAIFKEKRLMDYVTVTCATKCVGWAKDGKAKIETKCG